MTDRHLERQLTGRQAGTERQATDRQALRETIYRRGRQVLIETEKQTERQALRDNQSGTMRDRRQKTLRETLDRQEVDNSRNSISNFWKQQNIKHLTLFLRKNKIFFLVIFPCPSNNFCIVCVVAMGNHTIYFWGKLLSG